MKFIFGGYWGALCGCFRDTACCSAVRRQRKEKCSPLGLRGPQPRRAEARYSHLLIERTTAGCDPKPFHRGGFWVAFCPHKR